MPSQEVGQLTYPFSLKSFTLSVTCTAKIEKNISSSQSLSRGKGLSENKVEISVRSTMKPSSPSLMNRSFSNWLRSPTNQHASHEYCHELRLPGKGRTREDHARFQTKWSTSSPISGQWLKFIKMTWWDRERSFLLCLWSRFAFLLLWSPALPSSS